MERVCVKGSQHVRTDHGGARDSSSRPTQAIVLQLCHDALVQLCALLVHRVSVGRRSSLRPPPPPVQYWPAPGVQARPAAVRGARPAAEAAAATSKSVLPCHQAPAASSSIARSSSRIAGRRQAASPAGRPSRPIMRLSQRLHHMPSRRAHGNASQDTGSSDLVIVCDAPVQPPATSS